jgi:indole-3-glycerol phosphate synthase
MTAGSSPNLLATIVSATRRIVEVRERRTPLATVRRLAARRPDGRAFEAALCDSPAPRVIAECKRRSPSRGILRERYQPGAHARAYEDAGAAAISVLTEPTFFDGSLEHLRAARAAVSIPVLRKDFIVAEYQLAEAVAFGADAVLLIVGALTDEELRHLLENASTLALAALVEVHDAQELDRALAAGAAIVGVNSRNLRTLSVDPGVPIQLATAIPDDVIAVAESGVKSADDIRRLIDAGYDAFLVGERLISQPDPGAALRELRGTVRGS